MKLTRIISILFFFLFINGFAAVLKNDAVIFFNEKKVTSYLMLMQTEAIISEKDASVVIAEYNDAIAKGYVLKNDDLKKLSISYAIINDAEKSSDFLDRYIKKVRNFDILNNDVFIKIKDSKEFNAVAKKYEPELNGWILFFFSSGLIGIFIAVVLNLRKKGDTVANILLSLFVLFHSLFMIHLCLYLSKYNLEFPHSLYITASFSFLYGPLLYFYFKRITEKYEFKRTDLFHLIPSLVLFLFFLPIYSLSAEEKLEILYNRYETTFYVIVSVITVKSVLLIIYGYFIYKVYVKNLHENSNQLDEIKTWQKNLLVLNIIYIVSYIIYGFAIINETATLSLIYPQVFSMAIIVLYVSYVGYVQPKIFSKKYLFSEFVPFKYKKSGLTESYSHELKDQLLQLLIQDKVYKENNITLDILSKRLGVTRHNASQVINEHFDVNFFKLINRFRIYEAIHMLRQDSHNNMNIIDIAYEVGFNNKVTFNKAFKEETEMTPSQYLKKLQESQKFQPKLS